ncbi:MAG: hypothetical protein ACT4PZ_20365 [Panacagrimonas sp.]
MELDLSVPAFIPMMDIDESGFDELPGITADTATQVFGVARRHGVRLRVAAHWIMRARGMTVRSLSGEMEMSCSHLNQLFIHPHRHYFHRDKRRLLAERLGFDIWLYPQTLCSDSRPADLDSLLLSLRLLGMPAGLAANMALDARGIEIERDLCPLLGLRYRAIKRRLDGEVTPSDDERAVLVSALGFDPWPRAVAV